MAAKTKIITVAQALRCASHVRQGKACSQADLRATVLLLDTAVKTSRRSASAIKKRLLDSDNMVTRLMAKIGL